MISKLQSHQVSLFVISCIFAVASLACLAVRGLNWSLEFQGGTEIELTLSKSADPADLVNWLPAGVKLTPVGSHEHYLLRYPIQVDQEESDLIQSTQSILTQKGYTSTILSSSQVGAEFSQSMLQESYTALAAVFVGILLYVSIRFEWRLALGATLSLLFDPCIILGCFAFFGWKFDLPSIMGLLSVIGYSINDTIVVFDRFRENLEHMEGTSEDVFYRSLNQIFTRTILTSLLTSFVIIALFIFRTDALIGFALSFGIGIVTGTLSSLIIAGPFALWLGIQKEHLYPPIDPTLHDPLFDREFKNNKQDDDE
ncbi:MAG: protein translocase subunit SecF [Gammaproteobacteria bacterium]|nr:protein translocase subunit SecF [Gammaproteobacteria bacterium]